MPRGTYPEPPSCISLATPTLTSRLETHGRGVRHVVGRPACRVAATAPRGRRWWQGSTLRGGGMRWGGEGKRRGGAACEGAVVVARDGASGPSMWVGMRGSRPGVHGRGRRRGEGQVWVMGGRCVLVSLYQHIHGVVSAGASGKERAWVASDGNSVCVGKTD